MSYFLSQSRGDWPDMYSCAVSLCDIWIGVNPFNVSGRNEEKGKENRCIMDYEGEREKEKRGKLMENGDEKWKTEGE